MIFGIPWFSDSHFLEKWNRLIRMFSANKKIGGCILSCKTIVYHQGHAAQQLHAHGDIPFLDTNFGEAQHISLAQFMFIDGALVDKFQHPLCRFLIASFFHCLRDWAKALPGRSMGIICAPGVQHCTKPAGCGRETHLNRKQRVPVIVPV